MKLVILSAALALAATAALAQTPAPPPPTPASPPRGEGPPPPPPPRFDRAARGAEFRIERPDLRLVVRCADGESTGACSEIAMGMVDKLAGMRPSRPEPAARSDEDRGMQRRERFEGQDRAGPDRGGPDRGGQDRGGQDRGDWRRERPGRGYGDRDF